MVPRLKETHCLWVAWTKLNVLPEKIMQVRLWQTVKLELFKSLLIVRTSAGRAVLVYPSRGDCSYRCREDIRNLAYLEACHHLFERGFLCHDQIRGFNSEVLESINKGYRYFSGWLTDLLEQGISFNCSLNPIIYS